MKNQLIVCPVCKISKNNIKRHRLFDRLLFLIIVVQHETGLYTCCSQCMRKKIVKKTFNYTILTAWILWVLIIIPWHLIVYVLTFSPGHSNSVKKDVGIID